MGSFAVTVLGSFEGLLLGSFAVTVLGSFAVLDFFAGFTLLVLTWVLDFFAVLGVDAVLGEGVLGCTSLRFFDGVCLAFSDSVELESLPDSGGSVYRVLP